MTIIEIIGIADVNDVLILLISTSLNVLGFKSISSGSLFINLIKHSSTSFKETAQTEHCD